MDEPQAWMPTDPRARPTRHQVISGLKGTDEGGEELVQLLSPEGERGGDPRFDAYAADVGRGGAEEPLPRHGAGPPGRP